MRIMLKFVLDCDADAAWRALRSPDVFRAVAGPWMTFESLEPDGFPDLWPAGSHPVQAKALGLIDVGEQNIDISFAERAGGARLVNDFGGGISGPLAIVTTWRHTMAVAPLADGKTLYRDRLVVRAGILTLPVWFGMWLFWQWRGLRIHQLSSAWRA
jgi:hypothetical protein